MLAKKDPIEQNRRKLRPIWTHNQNWDLFEKTWQKLGQKRFNVHFFILHSKWNVYVIKHLNWEY